MAIDEQRAEPRGKRIFDIVGAVMGLVASSWLVVIGWAMARVSTHSSGVFRQTRIGRNGVPFQVLKLRTMRPNPATDATTVTRYGDPRITRIGEYLRAAKIDELPQLINVLRGEMSLVGPRADVPGWADELEGDDRVILRVRPGITGPASLAFQFEARLLAQQPDPERFNREVLYPAKTRMNVEYVHNMTIRGDLMILWRTFLAVLRIRPAPQWEPPSDA